MKTSTRLARATAVCSVVALALLGCAPEPVSEPDSQADPRPSEVTPQQEPEPEPEPEPSPAEMFDIDSADSLQVLVNKQRSLNPPEFEPADLVFPEGIPNAHDDLLRAEAAEQLTAMLAAAESAGAGHGMIQSGYRDYDRQSRLYYGYVSSLGEAGADLTSARPGHSEHQTGLAVDLTDGGDCTLLACFGDTALGSWLAEHSWEHGFVLRYPEGLTEVTGYEYEPWHFRYIGVAAAKLMHDSGSATLEEFFETGSAPTY